MKRVLTLVLALAMLVGVMTVSAGATYLEDPNHLTADNQPADLNTSDAGIAAGQVSGNTIGTKDVTVNIQTTGDVNTTHVYAVSYSVTTLTFTYENGGSRVWNPETLRYETSGAGGNWDSETQEITVTNYSDLAVKVSASVNQSGMAEEGTVTVTAQKQGDSATEFTLASAYNSGTPSASAATSDVFEVSVSGTPVNEYADPTQLATITLTLSKSE